MRDTETTLLAADVQRALEANGGALAEGELRRVLRGGKNAKAGAVVPEGLRRWSLAPADWREAMEAVAGPLDLHRIGGPERGGGRATYMALGRASLTRIRELMDAIVVARSRRRWELARRLTARLSAGLTWYTWLRPDIAPELQEISHDLLDLVRRQAQPVEPVFEAIGDLFNLGTRGGE